MTRKTSPQAAMDFAIMGEILQRKSSSRFVLVMACLTLAATAVYAMDPLAGDPAAREQKKEIRDVVLRLRSLEGVKSKNLEVQLGLAVFYRDYHSSMDYFERRDAQYARVLQIDPNNRVIWQMRADDAVGDALGTQLKTVRYLESPIENAQAYGRKQIYVTTGVDGNAMDPNRPWSVLYNVLGDKSGNPIKIEEKDYDQARAKVRQYADNALNEALKAVDECEKHDPENAYYNYRKAELYFNLRQPASAVQELQAAVRKPFIQAYVEQKEKAVTRALETADAPPGLFATSEYRSPATNYIYSFIWREYVDPLITKMENEGDLDQAKEIYKLAMGLAKQTREEPLPYVSDYNKKLGDAIERWAGERSSAIDKRTSVPPKPADSMPEKK
jgi:tetratricopeptide (TPR) repeat protein